MALCWLYYRNSGSLIVELMGGGDTDSRAYNETTVASVEISDEGALALLVAVVGSFILGMLFLVSYYLFFHPKAPVPLCKCLKQETIHEGHPDWLNFVRQMSVTDSSVTESEEECDTVTPDQQRRCLMTAVRRLYIPQSPEVENHILHPQSDVEAVRSSCALLSPNQFAITNV